MPTKDSNSLTEEEAATAGETATEDREVTANNLSSTVFAVNNKIVTVALRVAAVVEVVLVASLIAETTQTLFLLEILATVISKALSRC
jgi:hypothetical protein